MIELFIALFGGAYYISKFAGDKSKHNRTVRERTEREKIIREFMEATEPPHEFIMEVNKMVSSPDMHELVYKILHDDLTEVFGDNYREEFNLNDSLNQEYASHLIFSQHGYTSPLVHYTGFFTYFGNFSYTVVRICKQIENNLRASLMDKDIWLPEIVQRAKTGEYDEWSVHCTYLAFKHTLSPGEEYKRLWD